MAVYNGVTYDPNVDYQKQISQAEAKGDYTKAAELEEARNAKIAATGSNYEQTYKYTKNNNTGTAKTGTGLSATTGYESSYTGDYRDANGNLLTNANGVDGGYATLLELAMRNSDDDAVNYYNQLRNQALLSKGGALDSAYAYLKDKTGYKTGDELLMNDLQSQMAAQNDYLKTLQGEYDDLADALANAKYEYKNGDLYNTVDQLVQELYNMNYEDWTNTDQYRALADRYGTQGEMNMRDVLGQVASRTGGLASSYATTAAQQQYNDYMAQLEEIARQMYQSERGEKMEDINTAFQMYQDDYNKWLNSQNLGLTSKSTALNALNGAAGVAADLWGNAYNQYTYDDSMAYQRESDAYNRAYQEGQDAYNRNQTTMADARDRIDAYLAAGGNLGSLDKSLLAASGYTQPELNQLAAYYGAMYGYGGSGSGGSGSGGGYKVYGDGGGESDRYKQWQNQLASLSPDALKNNGSAYAKFMAKDPDLTDAEREKLADYYYQLIS